MAEPVDFTYELRSFLIEQFHTDFHEETFLKLSQKLQCLLFRWKIQSDDWSFISHRRWLLPISSWIESYPSS